MPYRSIYKPDLFAGKTVIVTGGGSGLGRCAAHELSALGARVALVGRNEEKLQATTRELIEDGGVASLHVCDIRDADVVHATVDAILERHGRIDGLVNNAGGQYRSTIRDMKLKGWEAVIRTNLTGGFIFSREVYVRWMERHSGSIVNIVADVIKGFPNYAHTAAARAGMMNFTETAAAEWAVSGVRVNAIAPGHIRSSGSDVDPSEEELLNIRASPMQRLGTESEISAAIVFLLSPGSAFVTGAVIYVDGGGNARREYVLPGHRNAPTFDGFHRGMSPSMPTKPK
jgi:citronellol/citronellal dehydrogenase